MSLYVSLLGPSRTVPCYCDCGHCHDKEVRDRLFDANITHNLGRMAERAGLYEPLWRPDEIGITTASELIAPLTDGIERLEADPDLFKQYNPSNGWGSYDAFVPWVRQYLNACKKYPTATVQVSR